jgi:hypothetical protein
VVLVPLPCSSQAKSELTQSIGPNRVGFIPEDEDRDQSLKRFFKWRGWGWIMCRKLTIRVELPRQTNDQHRIFRTEASMLLKNSSLEQQFHKDVSSTRIHHTYRILAGELNFIKMTASVGFLNHCLSWPLGAIKWSLLHHTGNYSTRLFFLLFQANSNRGRRFFFVIPPVRPIIIWDSVVLFSDFKFSPI